MTDESVHNEPAEGQVKNKTIGQVLAALESDFAGISASKIRFLEDKGLVSPQRTNTGYRKYSAQDIERLRYVLELQRDQYLPLKVIRERLADLDAGKVQVAQPEIEAVETQTAEDPAPSRSFTLRELGQEAEVDMPLLRELIKYGLLLENKKPMMNMIWRSPRCVIS